MLPVRTLLLLVAVTMCGCPRKQPANEENRDPYRNVTPQKVKEQVEKIEQHEDERNERRLQEMK